VADWLRSRLLGLQPSGMPEVLRRFHPSDATLSGDDIFIEDGAWLVDAREERVVRLFEVAEPRVQGCLLTYRATLKSEGLKGRAYLEMWCRLPGRGEFFSRGLSQPLKGTTDWTSHEIYFRLKKGDRPDLIKLNLAIEGTGKVWIKEVELLKIPK
jgi:hypothetical protein